MRSPPSPAGITPPAPFTVLLELWSSRSFQERMIASVTDELDVRSSSVVFLLGTRGPLRPADLADALVTGRSNVSKMLNRLEASGLIQRDPTDQDGRGARITLSPHGTGLADALISRSESMFTEITRDWPAERAERFVHDLLEFTHRAQDYTPPARE